MESHAMPYRTSGGVRWRAYAAVLAISAVAALLVAHTLTGARVSSDGHHVPARVLAETESSTGEGGGGGNKDRFPWSNAMLQWQRTGFHFQPDKHYMNDPNALMYYRGWYHFFYQYNPRGETWGNISWGHAVSRDMVNWRSLPLAMVPEHWYESNGVLTGSATLLPNGKVIVLYTGRTDTLAQVQCLAEPADPNDPLLRTWTKYPGNPVLFPPPGTYKKDFRDPMTAWFDKSDNTWRTVIGSKDDHGHAGIALMYKTKDFINFERWFKEKLLSYPLHEDSFAEEKLIFTLSQGAEHNLMTYEAYDINGYTFYTEEKDMKSDYQNSGVTMESYTGNDKDRYYGRIEEIWELSYAGEKVPMFHVKWAKSVLKEDRYFTTMVIPEAKSKTAGANVTAKNEPWVLASQVDQCFFITDPSKPIRVVVRRDKRNIIGMDGVANEEDFDKYGDLKMEDDDDDEVPYTTRRSRTTLPKGHPFKRRSIQGVPGLNYSTTRKKGKKIVKR